MVANTYTKKPQTRKRKDTFHYTNACPLGLVSRAMWEHTKGGLQRFVSPTFTDIGNHLQMVSRLWEVTGGVSISMH